MVEKEMKTFILGGPDSQQVARTRLVSALVENRFPQAVLIEGARGIGKKALAISLMQTLSCTDGEASPCGKCMGCKMAMNPGNVAAWVVPLETAEANAKSASEVSGTSRAKTVEEYKAEYVARVLENPYSVNIFSGISQISVDQIRSMTSQFSKASETVRVVIIAEADRMNDAAANALLKTLEEVPTNTYFILTSSNGGRLLQTIRSRCLTLRLPSLSDGEVSEISSRVFHEKLSPDALGMSLGSPGVASLYNENIAENETLAFDFLRDSIEGNYSDLFFELDGAFPKGPAAVDSAVMMLDIVAFLVADAIRIAGDRPVRLPDMRENLAALNLGRFGAEALEKAILEISKASEKIASRKNSVIVALETLSIGLLEGFKK